MPTKKYKAFLSYSHTDEAFGKWLHKQLERYKIPKKLYSDYPNLPKSLYPIFRDRYELNAGDDLGVEIPKALADSEALIVVCSPNSANSKWVNQEIIDFKMMYGEERIFPIIIDGEPFAKESDKFDDGLECFPEALKYRVDGNGNLMDERTSILASSTIEKEDGRELAKLKLIAGVLGVSFGEFYDRDKQEQNKRRAFLIGSLGVVSSLAGISVWKWFEADEKTLKVSSLLYHQTMEQGLIYKKYFNNPLKTKLIFAKAISQSNDDLQLKNAKILYNSIKNSVKIQNIFEQNYPVQNVILADNLLLGLSGNEIKVWNLELNKNLFDLKHDAKINGAVLTKRKNFLLSWSDDNTIRLWNLKDAKQTLILKHDFFVSGAMFSHDESQIVVWSYWSEKIKLWSVEKRKQLLEFYHNLVNGVIFSKDDRRLLSWGDDHKVKLWSVNDTRPLHIFEHDSGLKSQDKSVNGATFNKDMNYILSWSNDSTVRLWNVNSGKLISILKHDFWVSRAIFSKYRNLVLSWGWDSELKLWEIGSNKPLKKFTHKDFVGGAVFSKDEKRILSWANNTLILWHIESKEKVLETEHNDYVKEAKFSNDENYILSWSRDEVYVRRIRDEALFVLKHDDKVNGAFFTKDNKQVITWSEDKNIKLWKIFESESLYTINIWKTIKSTNIRNEISKISIRESNQIKIFNNDMTSFIKLNSEYMISSINSKIKLWNMSTESISPLKEFMHEGVKEVIFSKSNQYLLSLGNDKIKLINIGSNQIYEYNHKLVKGAMFNQDETRILSWDDYAYDGKIKLWSIKNNNLELTLQHNQKSNFTTIDGAILSIDDKYMLSWTDNPFTGDVKLWNVSTLDCIFTYEQNNIKKAILSRNRKKILCYTLFINEGEGLLLDIATGKPSLFLKHDDVVNGVMFSSNEKNILSWSKDKTVKFWSIQDDIPLLVLQHESAVNGATLSDDAQYILSWTSDNIYFWSITHDKFLFSINGSVEKAAFSRDERQILFWSEGGFLQVYDIYRSEKFNNNYYPLEVEVETGAYLTLSGEVKALSKDEWLQKKKKYEQILKESNP